MIVTEFVYILVSQHIMKIMMSTDKHWVLSRVTTWAVI